MIKICIYDKDIIFYLNSEYFGFNKVFFIEYIYIEVKFWFCYIYYIIFSKNSVC